MSASTLPSHQRGMSLVELMVALTLGLFLLGIVGALYLFTSQSTRASTLQAQMNEDAMLALELIGQQLRLAGFSNQRAAPEEGQRNFQGLALMGCDGGFSNAHNSANTDHFEQLACTATASGPDALAVRYEATALNALEVTTSTGAVQPANCAYEDIAAWSLDADAPTITLAENRYFIASDPTDNNEPSLRCRGRNGSGFSSLLTLVPNIEDMQLLYAVTRQPAPDEPMPQQVTAYRSAAQIDHWSRVVAARVCVVARSAERVPGLTAELGQYVNCAGERVQAPADGRLRRAYTTTVVARNLRPGLPAPHTGTGSPWATENGNE